MHEICFYGPEDLDALLDFAKAHGFDFAGAASELDKGQDWPDVRADEKYDSLAAERDRLAAALREMIEWLGPDHTLSQAAREALAGEGGEDRG